MICLKFKYLNGRSMSFGGGYAGLLLLFSGKFYRFSSFAYQLINAASYFIGWGFAVDCSVCCINCSGVHIAF